MKQDSATLAVLGNIGTGSLPKLFAITLAPESSDGTLLPNPSRHPPPRRAKNPIRRTACGGWNEHLCEFCDRR
jgi:hypothetical protein